MKGTFIKDERKATGGWRADGRPRTATGGSRPDGRPSAEAHEPARTEQLRRVARSGGISLAGSVASSVLGFALVVLVSRGLGAAGAGVFSVVAAVVMTLTVAGRLGTDTALVRALARLRELGRDADVRTAVLAALLPLCVATTIFAAAMWWLAPVVAPLLFNGYRTDDAAQLLRVSSTLVPLGAGSWVALAATRSLGSVVPLTVIESIVKPAARCVFVSVALLAGAGVYGTTVAWALPMALGAALAAVSLRRVLRRVPAKGPIAKDSRRTWKELWVFAGPRGVASLFEIAGMHAGIVLTSALAGAEDAGVYNAVIRVALAGTLALQALRLAVAPRISRMLTSGDVAGVEHIHQASTTWVVLLSFPLYLVFAAWPGQVLALFGPEFRDGSVALTILACALLVNLATGNVATVLLMNGRSALTLAITAVSLGLGIALTVVLAPAYGVIGAAIAKATSVVFENLAVALAVWLDIGVRTSCRPVWQAAGLAVVCFGVPPLPLHAVGANGLTTAALMILAGSAAYLASCWRLRETFQLAAARSVVPGRLDRLFRRPAASERSGA